MCLSEFPNGLFDLTQVYICAYLTVEWDIFQLIVDLIKNVSSDRNVPFEKRVEIPFAEKVTFVNDSFGSWAKNLFLFKKVTFENTHVKNNTHKVGSNK